MTNAESKRRRGRKSLPDADLRKHPVTCRLTDAEAAKVDAQRGAISRGEYIRRAALGRVPPVIPALNREAWADLARSAGNLATVANAMRAGGYVEADELRRVVAEFRLGLIGAKS